MNNKGQVGVGILVMTAMAIIVGAIILTSSAQNIGDVTNTRSTSNDTLVIGALHTLANLQGKFVDTATFVAFNSTNSSGGTVNRPIITSGNYSFLQNQVVNGAEVARLNVTGTQFVSQSWLVTYTYEPTTYISNSGGRSIATIVLIFLALAIAMVALLPALRSGVVDMIRR